MMKRKVAEESNEKENKKTKIQESEPDNLVESSDQNPSPEDELENGSENVDGTTRKKKAKTSYVWNHFSVRSSDDQKTEFAHCNYCESKYKLSGKSNGGTGNLNTHLKIKHPDRLPQEINLVPDKFVFSQESYREALVNWIILSDQPFCECGVQSFLKMIATLNPDATTISKETVKRDILKKFEAQVETIKLKLKKVSRKFSFTLDAWTSRNTLPFMAIRAHWINDIWEYESVLLDFSFIKGNHGGPNFSKIFLQCLARFDISLSNVLGVTIDNVSSNDTFISCLESHGIKVGIHFNSKENRVRCMPHILNLGVKDIMRTLKIPLSDEQGDEQKSVDEESEDEFDEESHTEEESEDEDDGEEDIETNEFSVVKLRKLVKKIRKSTQKRQKLHKLCQLYEVKYLVPIIDVSTRWNSTFEMIQRAAHLKAPLRALCTNEPSLNKFLTTEPEWTNLDKLKVLLQKFDRATQLMSMERHPAVSAYLPTLNWLLESLKSFIQSNTGSLAESAENGLLKLQKYERELHISNSKIPYIGVFLNPSLKMSYFKEHGYSKPLMKEIQKSISETFERYTSSSQTDEISEEESNDEFFEHMHKRTVSKEPKEMQKYLQFPLSSPKVNILQYWRSQKEEFPNLSNMAQDYLAVQSGSVAVERDFSTGSNLVTPKRCALLPETIRACLCLKSWLKNLE